MNNKAKSVCLLVLTSVIWGFAFTAQCMVDTDVLGNFSFNGIRFILGAVSLIPIILLFEKEKKDIKKLKHTVLSAAVCGSILFAASALQQHGISINHNAGKCGFITGLYIVLVPFMGSIFFKNKTNIFTWIAAVFAVSGLFLLSVGDGFDKVNFGDVVIFIGAFFWAAHILVIDKLVGGVSPIKFSCIQFFVCGLWNLVFAAFSETITWSGVQATMIPILYTGIMSTGVAYTCQILGQRGCDPNFSAIILSTECVFSAIGGAIILHEVMTAKGYAGCVLIFIGILLSQMKKKEEKCSAAEGSCNNAECNQHMAER